MLSSNHNPASCNPPSLIRLYKNPNPRAPIHRSPTPITSPKPTTITNLTLAPPTMRGRLQTRRSYEPEAPLQAPGGFGPAEKTGGGPGKNDWTTSFLLLGFWVAVMFYVFQLAPNQTPYRDSYFLQKLLYLKGDDGFELNPVLVALWFIMGLWPLVYSMLLVPTGRSSRSVVPVWPFLVLSCFGGAYALIPYFVLWRPPPPPVREDEVNSRPLKFLESKITAGVSLAAGIGLVVYACLAGGEAWTEFYQYFRESKLVHITALDFSLLSAFAPFWVYNDMTSRRSSEKSYWLLPVALIPFIGPALYIFLRPPLSALPMSPTSTPEETY